jgi:hypothetical protein
MNKYLLLSNLTVQGVRPSGGVHALTLPSGTGGEVFRKTLDICEFELTVAAHQEVSGAWTARVE